MQVKIREQLERNLNERRAFTDNLEAATRLEDRIHVTVSCTGDSMAQVTRTVPAVVEEAFDLTDSGGVSGVVASSDWFVKFNVDGDVRESEGARLRAQVRESIEPYPSSVFD